MLRVSTILRISMPITTSTNVLDTLEILEGGLPKKQLRLVQAWA
jgi:hypothetical protein